MNAQKFFALMIVCVVLLTACQPAATQPPATAIAVSPGNGAQNEAPKRPAPTQAPSRPAVQPTKASEPTKTGASQARPLATAAPERLPEAYRQPTLPPVYPPADNQFLDYGVNPWESTRQDHLSTFSLDVDTGSYTITRRYIQDGFLPPYAAVRAEEFINYFKQGYVPPRDSAFALYADGAPSPFHRDGSYLLRVGVQGYTVPDNQRQPANLVFVIDVSGSMEMENRLGLVKRSLQLLIDRLRPDDTVGIVVFGSNARIVMQPTSARERQKILNAVNGLRTEGSTNMAEGLRMGYKMALSAYREGSNNRVILCSDGVANTGATQAEQILGQIQGYVEEGIFLNTYGFGMGNLNDELMEKMADKGNGAYAYIDTLDEAHRQFVERLTSALQTIALDAKVQVDFNPDVVSQYRLIGYENRAVADEDFRNDEVDAAEMGAGHAATAIYAVQLAPNAKGRLATLQVRWTDPQTRQSREFNGNFNTWDLRPSFDEADARYQMAVVVAQFAEILRESPYARDTNLSRLSSLAYQVQEALPGDEDVAELAQLIAQAARITRRAQ